MLQFVQPIWLFALGALAAPVLIHLWNDRRGKALLVGSIHFLGKESRRQSRNPRISEWLLLILRCLLLTALALLLAGPVWRSQPEGSKKGWVLVGDSAVARFGTIDSLVKAGFVRKEMGSLVRQPNWWASFDSLDRLAPAGLPFYVFTDGQIGHFRGERPVTEREVDWMVRSDSVDRHGSVKAWRIGDSVVVRTQEIRSTGSVYRLLVDDPADVKDVKIDTTPLRVSIVADAVYAQDGRYLASALKALRRFTKKDIRVSEGLDRSANWCFWLSTKPAPPQFPGNMIVYSSGKEVKIESRIADLDIPLMRRISDSSGAEPIWTDGFGMPLLTRDSGRVFHLYTHFDPAWNGLVWSARFPAILWGGIIGPTDHNEDSLSDMRMLDPLQIRPVKGKKPTRFTASPSKDVEAGVDLGPACWMLVLVLLLVERMIVYRTKNKVSGRG